MEESVICGETRVIVPWGSSHTSELHRSWAELGAEFIRYITQTANKGVETARNTMSALLEQG